MAGRAARAVRGFGRGAGTLEHRCGSQPRPTASDGADELSTPIASLSLDAPSQVPECSICLDECLTPTLTCCELPHAFCLACLFEVCRSNVYGEQVGKCPLCRSSIALHELTALSIAPRKDAAEETEEDEAEGEEETAMSFSSSKLDALIGVLGQRSDEHPKSIVFTHFSATLSLVVARLNDEGIKCVHINAGTVRFIPQNSRPAVVGPTVFATVPWMVDARSQLVQSQAARSKAFHTFQSDPEVQVFVLLMKAAAVGLTLTCANRVILLEPGLNLADEAQAIGRVHRLGQERPCSVVRMALSTAPTPPPTTCLDMHPYAYPVPLIVRPAFATSRRGHRRREDP